MANQEQNGICREIGARTGGDIYIGVVGPVRSGKSTFIKRFMEQLVLPAIGPAAARERARDELPQSAAGRTIMTTEPKFIPETAVPLQLEGGGECRVRPQQLLPVSATGRGRRRCKACAAAIPDRYFSSSVSLLISI